ASSVADAHNIVSQHRLLVFRFLQENLQNISRMKYSYWLRILVHDRNIFQFALFHSFPDILKQIASPTDHNVARHRQRSCHSATLSLTLAHLVDNVGLRDDSSHKTGGTAHDHEVGPFAQELCCVS